MFYQHYTHPVQYGVVTSIMFKVTQAHLGASVAKTV